MKKRVLACILVMVCVLASAMSVSAAGSNQQGSNEADVIVVTPSELFEAVASDQKVENASADVTNKVKDMTALATFEIKAKGSESQLPKEITLQVDALGDKVTGAVLVVKGQNGWKAIDAKVSGNKVTATFDEIGPVVLYVSTSTGTGTGTSPSTDGTSSTWMIMAAAMLIMVGVGVVASQKKSR